MLEELPKKIPKHFSEIILKEYDSRKTKNSKYSLRAFARDLEISSGKLSDILSGKVGILEPTGLKIAKKLKISSDDEKLFLNLVEINSQNVCAEKQAELKNKLYNHDSSYVVLKDDFQQVWKEWYYMALVELVALKDFIDDDHWISQRLGIEVSTVRPAIELLVRTKLLSRVDGNLAQTYDFFVSPGGSPSAIIREFHKQILIRAAEAIENQDISERNITSGFMRVRKADLPYISNRIKEFRRELIKEIEAGEDHDSVYALSINFFRGDRDFV